MRSSFFLLVMGLTYSSLAQLDHTPADHCKSDELMEAYYQEHQDREVVNQELIRQNLNDPYNKDGGTCYVIPVVFHVYGTTQGGYPVNQTIIQGALDGVNDDFQALNADWNDVHNDFLGVRGSMPDVYFMLAQLDPNGNQTNGIVNHPVASGFGYTNGTTVPLIQADAWNNYSYMNVFIMNDIYGDGMTNNSGVAWYPDEFMSDNNIARVVYNGRYLGANCDFEPEFASVLTHEFGHWLDLRHTFKDGCTFPNDFILDTPPCDYWADQYTCHTSNSVNFPLNCNNDLINVENYMDYSPSDGCARMFSQGQNDRMYAALSHPARVTLWQQSNLIATGLADPCAISAGIDDEQLNEQMSVYPNPSSTVLFIELPLDAASIEIIDLRGRILDVDVKQNGELRIVNVNEIDPGYYLIRSGNSTIRVLVQ